MVAIRKTQAKSSGEDFGPDAVLDLSQGALLKLKSPKLFPPKFNEETGDLWSSTFSVRMEVLDDHTEDGQDDGAEFFDRFDLKLDEKLGYDDKELKDANSAQFTKEQREVLLDQDNWTVREGTKLDNLLSALYGKKWIEGKMDFNPEDLDGAQIIAKVSPRTGKRPGSYCSWDTFMNPAPPKKQKKKGVIEQAQKEASEAANNAELDELPNWPLSDKEAC